jgi:uracil-DNA glycosylase
MAPGRAEVEGTAAAFIPKHATLPDLMKAAAGCRACPLWESASRTIFGEGLEGARLILVGEQPGDQEDKNGRPFVGPAGRVLDEALEEAGIDRQTAYVTNVVKHFKWVPKGKRRLHQKPNAREIGACLPWLEEEIAVIKPEVVVALGSTAAQALFGKQVKVTDDHGRFLPSPLAPHATVTLHPSAILRVQIKAAQQLVMEGLVADLRKVAAVLAQKKA